MTKASHIRFRLVTTLVVLLGVVAAGAACADAAHAQQVDESLPPLADLTIASEYDFDDYHGFGFVSWAVTVKNNSVGAHPGMQFYRVKVRYTISDRVRGDTESLWTISNLPPGGSATRTVRSLVTRPGTNDGPAKVAQRIYAEIIESDPVESSRFRFNNATEHWALVNRRAVRSGDGANYFNNGDVGLFVTRISNPFPQQGEVTTFTVTAGNDSGNFPGIRRQVQDHSMLEVQVEISLSPGLSFAGTQPEPPSGTMFDTTTGRWNIGTLEDGSANDKSLPVAVNLTADSLADLPMESRCLTAKVGAVPWFASDPLRQLDDTATACLGKELLTQGEIPLLDYLDCVGVASTPCTSADTLELLVGRSRGDLQPEEVLVQVQDPQGRHNGKWRTGKTTHHLTTVPDTQGVGVIFSFLPRSYNSYTFVVSDLSPKQRPGTFSIIGNNVASFTILNADTMKTLGPVTLPASITNNPYPAILEFGALGTYKINLTVGATKSSTPYTDTSTYTFHVGPVADLAVRDAGANPEVAAGQSAYTIVAVNNGPDDAPAQVTLTNLNAGDYVSHTATNDTTLSNFDPATGVWTIGELKNKDYYQAVYDRDGEALTIITSAAVDTEITAAISNEQDYQVCIDSSGGDVAAANQAACTSPNTWHTAKYYDYISGNNSATIRAKEGTGANLPVIESVEAVGPAAIKITWSEIAEVNGRPVTHYEVERETNPQEIVADDVTGTWYVDTDMEAAGNPQYRVRGVNEFGQEGPWSLPSGGRPGAPSGFSATVNVDSRQITLSWSAPQGVTVTGYHLDYSTDGGGTWNWLPAGQTRTALPATPTSYGHTVTLTPGATWHYRVRAVGADFTSDWEETSATVPYPKPNAPVSFAATGQSETQAELTWTVPATVTGVTVTGYELGFSTDGGGNWTMLTDTSTLSGTTRTMTHSDSNLAADAVRQYRARTTGAVGSVTVESGWVYALATENYPAPGAPRNFTATADSDTEVTLRWRVPEAVASVTLTGYVLEVSFDRGATWNSVADASTLGSGADSHTHDDDANPLSSKPRQYRLKAVGTVGGSTYESGWVFAVPAEEVGAPQNLTAEPDEEDGRTVIDLSWDQPASGADLVTGYRIDYTPAAPEQWQALEHNHGRGFRSYEHTGRLPGERYCYRVAATYAGGTGPFTARVCATTDGSQADLPGKPENLRVAQVGSNFVTLEWDPPSGGAAVESYEYRSNVHAPTAVSPRTATRVRVGGLQPGEVYDFQVQARNSVGPSGWSRPVVMEVNRAGSAVKTSTTELEVDKGGSGSFNVRLNRPPQWPLILYNHSTGRECLTQWMAYQQGKILLPTNPPPSREFWEDGWWGPTDDRWAAPWNTGVEILVDAFECQGGETAVIEYSLHSLPFSSLEGVPLWDVHNLNEEEWREKWGVDPLDGITGPSVKVTVADTGPTGNVGGQQGAPAPPAQPTAVTLALGAATVSERAGQATVTATLDAPAPEGGIGGFLFADVDGTASQDIDFTMPFEIFIPGGERSATASISITGDDVDEEDETVVMSALFDIGTALLEDRITLTIQDDDTAGVTVSAASPLSVDEGATAAYTVVLDSRPTADVTVTPASGDVDAASVYPVSHTFTPSGWNTARTFTVSGVADDDTSDETVGISHGVTSGDPKYAAALLSTVSVSVSDTTQQQGQGTPNQPPTVSNAIADAAIVNQSGTHQVSLSGVFSDADNDSLTVTAASSDNAVATVSVASDYSTLTVSAQARGTATVTVTADDGNGGTVEDEFTVTVKAAPTVASAISDVSGLKAEATREVSLSGVFSDADSDALTITAASSDKAIAKVTVASGGSKLTLTGVAQGTATITVTARDSDGNTVSDAFDVSVVGPPSPATNLRCIAKTGQVAFLWDAPTWSGGEVYAYDYDLTLPTGKREQVRLRGSAVVNKPGEYQAGGEASISVKVVYELADGSEVSSAAAALTCTVAE